MAKPDAARRSHPDCWLLGHRMGEQLMQHLLAHRLPAADRRVVLADWVHTTLMPGLQSIPGLLDDPTGTAVVGRALARAAVDVGDHRGERTRAVVLLLEICGACHHVLGYEPELMLKGTGRAARVELVAA
jgi:hypothetical protein